MPFHKPMIMDMYSHKLHLMLMLFQQISFYVANVSIFWTSAYQIEIDSDG